jgi:hypothetical protein
VLPIGIIGLRTKEHEHDDEVTRHNAARRVRWFPTLGDISRDLGTDGEAVVCGPDGIAVFERACVRCHLTTTSVPSVAIRGARPAAGLPVIGFLSGFGRHWNQLAI